MADPDMDLDLIELPFHPTTCPPMATIEDLPPELITEIFVQLYIDTTRWYDGETYYGYWFELLALAMTSKKFYTCFNQSVFHAFSEAAKELIPSGPGMFELAIRVGVARLAHPWVWVSSAVKGDELLSGRITETLEATKDIMIRDLVKPPMFGKLLLWALGHSEQKQVWSKHPCFWDIMPLVWNWGTILMDIGPEFRAEVYRMSVECDLYNFTTLSLYHRDPLGLDSWDEVADKAEVLLRQLKQRLAHIRDHDVIFTITVERHSDRGAPVLKFQWTTVSTSIPFNIIDD